MRKYILLAAILAVFSSTVFAKTEISTYAGITGTKPLQLDANIEKIAGLQVEDMAQSAKPILGVRIGWSEVRFGTWLSYEMSKYNYTCKQEAYTIKTYLKDSSFGIGANYILYQTTKLDASLGMSYSWVIPYGNITVSDTKDDGIRYENEYDYKDQIVAVLRPELKMRYTLEPSITLDLVIGYSFGKADNAALPRDYSGLSGRIGLGITF